MEYYIAMKGMKYWCLLQCGWTWKSLCLLRERRRQGLRMPISFIQNTHNRDRKQSRCWHGLGEGPWQMAAQRVLRFLLRRQKCSGARKMWQIHNVNVWSDLELFTLIGYFLVTVNLPQLKKHLKLFHPYDKPGMWALFPPCFQVIQIFFPLRYILFLAEAMWCYIQAGTL